MGSITTVFIHNTYISNLLIMRALLCFITIVYWVRADYVLKATEDAMTPLMVDLNEKLQAQLGAIAAIKSGNQKRHVFLNRQAQKLSHLDISVKHQRSHIETLQEKLKSQISEEAPVSFHCAFRQFVSTDLTLVTYDKLTYERTNQWTSEGGLDISSGTLTAVYTGTYSISYSLMAGNGYMEDDTHLFLRYNGGFIYETFSDSFYGAGEGGSLKDMGSRSWVLHLDAGDT